MPDLTVAADVDTFLQQANFAAMRGVLSLGTLATQNGTFSGTSSGTNTGDQTITLTGDVTGSGVGSFVTTISPNSVTSGMLVGAIANAKLANSQVTIGTSAVALGATITTIAGLLNLTVTGVNGTCNITPSGTSVVNISPTGGGVTMSPAGALTVSSSGISLTAGSGSALLTSSNAATLSGTGSGSATVTSAATVSITGSGSGGTVSIIGGANGTGVSVTGGTSTGCTLSLRSTSGSGSTGAITFQTGLQVTRLTLSDAGLATFTVPVVMSGAALRMGVFTIGTLPAGVTGDCAIVSNGITTPGYQTAVGTTGAVVAQVTYNGAQWVYS